jgi:hypothetical protein
LPEAQVINHDLKLSGFHAEFSCDLQQFPTTDLVAPIGLKGEKQIAAVKRGDVLFGLRLNQTEETSKLLAHAALIQLSHAVELLVSNEAQIE